MGLIAVACGGGETTPQTQSDAASDDAEAPPILSTGGTIGGLDKLEVQRVIQRVWPDVNRCVNQGRTKLAFLGGDVGISITVASTGRASEVFLHDSTLGDHKVETCIVKAFSAKQWPRPVGGDVGKIDQTFAFAAGHAEPPLAWTAATLEKGMAKEAEDGEKPFAELIDALRGCQTAANTGPLTVTMYLDEDGFVQSVGMGMSDVAGVGAIDCIVQTMKTTSFPAPELNYAKVTVTVR